MGERAAGSLEEDINYKFKGMQMYLILISRPLLRRKTEKKEKYASCKIEIWYKGRIESRLIHCSKSLTIYWFTNKGVKTFNDNCSI